MTTSSHTVNAVERSCIDLVREGERVTFTAIATGLSRSTLYRNTRYAPSSKHHKRATDGPMTAITEEIATLRAAVSALAERVRSHEEQLRRLRN
jgi:hypothetical protein